MLHFKVKTLGILLFLSTLNIAQTVNTSVSAFDLSDALSGNGIIIQNPVLNCGTGASATFSNASATIMGIDQGIILSTGFIEGDPNGWGQIAIFDPNDPQNTTSSSTNNNFNDPDLIQLSSEAIKDVCKLEFDLIPTCSQISINYVFASEEYPDFVCSNYNDAFGFFISGPGINGPFSNNSINLATIPNSNDYVAINSINGGVAGMSGDPANCGPTGLTNTQYYISNNNTTNFSMNGLTVPLTAYTTVQPCETYHIKLIIADAYDNSYDSGVFLTFEGLTCTSDPSLEVHHITDTAIEGCKDIRFQIERNLDVNQQIAIQLQSVNSSATSGTDYFAIDTTIIFIPFDTLAEINLSAFQDYIGEGIEEVQLVMSYQACNIDIKDTLQFYIMDLPELNLGKLNTHCGICDGIAFLPTLPTELDQPYNISWNTPNGIQIGDSIINLCAGTYYAQLTDSNNCAIYDSVRINTIGPLFTLQVIAESCRGLGDGQIICIPADSSLFYEYTLNNTAQFNGTFSNLSPGSFTFQLNDTVNNCASDTMFSVAPGPCCLTVLASSTNMSCSNICDGTASGLFSGNIGTTSVNWTNQTGSNLGNNNLTGLCSGYYTINVSDSLCNADTTVAVIQPLPVAIAPVSDSTVCIDGIGVYNASAINGTSPYTYNWSNGYIGSTQMIQLSSDSALSVTAMDANGCLSQPIVIEIFVLDSITPHAIFDNYICEGIPTALLGGATGGNGILSYNWSTPQGFSSSDQNTEIVLNESSTITLTVSDQCETPAVTLNLTITVENSLPVSFSSDLTEGCEPLQVGFFNTTPGNNIAQTIWLFSNGDTSTNPNPNIYFNMDGSYDVGLTLISDSGCVSLADSLAYLTVYPLPEPNFHWYPQNPSILSSDVTFYNTTMGSNTYFWNFYLQGSSTDEQPEVHYPNDLENSYNVCLLATTDKGCIDSICKPLTIKNILTLYVPNAFTPNNDGVNDIFYAVAQGFDVSEFTLQIFDRWGHIIFESDSPNRGWDGTINSQIAPQGVYIWKCIIKDKYAPTLEEKTGHITLIR